jgi:pantetheine-phosphate adenylyltransferase
MRDSFAPLHIAVTGGIAAGKSTVHKDLLAKLPDFVGFSIDQIVADIYSEVENDKCPDEAIRFMRTRLIGLFGTVNKAEVAAATIGKPDLLAKLENIFALAVTDKLESILSNNRKVLIEFPLLCEKEWADRFHFIINVEADARKREVRALGREHMSVKKFEHITSVQMTPVDRKKALEGFLTYTFMNNTPEDRAHHVDVLAIRINNFGRRLGIVSGSFDPITKGHIHLVNKGLELLEGIVIVVAYNPNKKGMFTAEERIAMIKGCEFLHNARVSVLMLPPKELVVKLAKDLDAKYIIRGLRNTTDFEYERQIDMVQTTVAPEVDTLFFMTPRELTEVSSSLVKSFHGMNGWEKIAEPYVPQCVLEALKEKLI